MWAKHLNLVCFRGFKSLDLDLDRPLTVLIGANGSGKTSVLRAVASAQSWLLSIYNRRHELPGVELDERDLRLGATHGEILTRWRHGAYDFGFRVWWSAEEPKWQGFFHESSSNELFREAGRPYLFLVGTDRHVARADVRSARPMGGAAYADDPDEEVAASRGAEDEGAVAARPGYARFIEWFKEREDVENERRVATRDLELQDPQLRAVREAIEAVMPGFGSLRIQRSPTPVMVAAKGAQEFRLDQLSGGERNLLALTGDLARRLAIATPTGDSPRDAEAVILIDEVEQHLHPALQRKIVPALQRAFPKAQLIVTTHSPQVLSSVPASAVVLLDSFGASPVSSPTRGRDTNAILREVFGTPARPDDEHETIREIAALLDTDRLHEARRRLDELALRLSEHDEEVLTLRARLDFAEVGL